MSVSSKAEEKQLSQVGYKMLFLPHDCSMHLLTSDGLVYNFVQGSVCNQKLESTQTHLTIISPQALRLLCIQSHAGGLVGFKVAPDLRRQDFSDLQSA